MEQVEKLEPQQADVIKKYYLNGHTLRQIAEHEGVTIEVIRQRESKALRKLRGYPSIRKMGRELYADEHTCFYLHIGVNAFQSGAGSAPELLSERRNLLLSKGAI
jgi:hypothetical protein